MKMTKTALAAKHGNFFGNGSLFWVDEGSKRVLWEPHHTHYYCTNISLISDNFSIRRKTARTFITRSTPIV